MAAVTIQGANMHDIINVIMYFDFILTNTHSNGILSIICKITECGLTESSIPVLM